MAFLSLSFMSKDVAILLSISIEFIELA